MRIRINTVQNNLPDPDPNWLIYISDQDVAFKIFKFFNLFTPPNKKICVKHFHDKGALRYQIYYWLPIFKRRCIPVKYHFFSTGTGTLLFLNLNINLRLKWAANFRSVLWIQFGSDQKHYLRSGSGIVFFEKIALL